MSVINSSNNEYQHLKISEILDYSQSLDKPMVKIKTIGRTLINDKVLTYSLLVYVTGKLMDYVLAELQKGDDIFVIGKTYMVRPQIKSVVRAMRAEYIYREDWIKFYNVNRRASLKEVQDKFMELSDE